MSSCILARLIFGLYVLSAIYFMFYAISSWRTRRRANSIDAAKIKIVKQCRQGDVVILRLTSPHFSKESIRQLRSCIQQFSEETGIRFVLLDNAIEIVDTDKTMAPPPPPPLPDDAPVKKGI